MKSFADFRAYQVWMRNLLRRQNKALVALDMGMGKTVICWRVIKEDMYDTFRYCLIVAPLNVAENTWPDELDEWEDLKCLKNSYSLLTGTEAQREKAARTDVPVHIINKENIPWLWRFWKDQWPYDMVIWDESSALKTWSLRTDIKRLTRFGAMAVARKYVKRIYLLTGTPAPNGLYDLGGQAFILDRGERLGMTKKAFTDRWFDKSYDGYSLEPKPQAFDQIMGRMKDVMVSLRARDYIDLPPQMFVPRYIDLPKKLMAQYTQFEEDLYSEAYDVEAVSRGVLTNKLLQFANGSMYRNFEDGTRELVPIHDLKLEPLERVIEEENGHNIMVSYSFQFDVDLICKNWPKAVVYDSKDKTFIRLWNAGKIPLALAHSAQIGHGTNIQFGGHILVWYGLTWNLEHWQQFNERFPRSGQSAPICYVYPIIARGTNDEIVYGAMGGKGATQDRINAAVRHHIIDRRDR